MSEDIMCFQNEKSEAYRSRIKNHFLKKFEKLRFFYTKIV